MKNIAISVKDKIYYKKFTFLFATGALLLLTLPVAVRSRTAVPLPIPDCAKTDQVSQDQCWQNSLLRTYQQSGFSNSYKLFSELYKYESRFRENCHSFTHTLGLLAYESYTKNKSFNFGSDLSLCNYGFFHGFMESLDNHGNNLSQADQLCQMLKQQLSTKDPQVNEQCYHGIGHASSTTHDPSLIPQTQARINRGLLVCEALKISDELKRFCFVGSFGSIFNQEEYNSVSVLKKKPALELCSQQLDRYQEGCLFSAIGHLRHFSNDYYDQSLSFILNMKIKESSLRSMIQLSNRRVAEVPIKPDYSKDIASCHHSSTAFQSPCIIGLTLGIRSLQKEDPGSDVSKDFCNSAEMNAQEKFVCAEAVKQ